MAFLASSGTRAAVSGGSTAANLRSPAGGEATLGTCSRLTCLRDQAT
jgi:hypothetical protein